MQQFWVESHAIAMQRVATLGKLLIHCYYGCGNRPGAEEDETPSPAPALGVFPAPFRSNNSCIHAFLVHTYTTTPHHCGEDREAGGGQWMRRRSSKLRGCSRLLPTQAGVRHLSIAHW